MIRPRKTAPFLHAEESSRYRQSLIRAADLKVADERLARELAHRNELRRALSHSMNRLALAG